MDSRYVQRRRNADGSWRYYWRRPGHKLATLSAERWAQQATQLNAQADLADAGTVELGPEPGTVAWVIATYRQADWYTRRADDTKRAYERYLREIEEMIGALTPAGALTPKWCAEYIHGTPGSLYAKHIAAAVVRNVCTVARQHGLMTGRPTADLKLEAPAPRSEVWEPEDIQKLLAAVEGEDAAGFRVAFHLLVYTGQRPSDVVKMRRDDLIGDTIRVAQKKTGRKIVVPCHRDLLAVLKAQPASMFLAVRGDGRPFTRDRLGAIARQARTAAGLRHLQLRDMRRTAVLRMREAGASLEDIASVTGHSLKEITSILERVYWQRSEAQARRAIKAWEDGT